MLLIDWPLLILVIVITATLLIGFFLCLEVVKQDKEEKLKELKFIEKMEEFDNKEDLSCRLK